MTLELAPSLSADAAGLRFVVEAPLGLGGDISLTRWALTAERDLPKSDGAHFAVPPRGVDIRASAFGSDARFLGYSFVQFAWPALASATAPFDLHPEGDMISPPAVVPLAVTTDDDAVLFAPLDHWHEHIIAIDQTEDGPKSFRWSWHGDLSVEAGFRSRSACSAVRRSRRCSMHGAPCCDPTDLAIATIRC